MEITVSAPINIAITKYWGKSDEFNIHPLNDSISLTVSQDELNTSTHLSTSTDYTECRFMLNNKQLLDLPSRVKDVIILAQLRSRLRGRNSVPRFVHIQTKNNFPTAAGLASSASGLAAVAFGLVRLYGLEDSEIPELARRGSGSSCRSTLGGMVLWHTKLTSPLNSHVTQLHPASHWSSLKILICLIADQAKSMGSTHAMRFTVDTSPLYHHGRPAGVQNHTKQLVSSLNVRDFEQFAQIAMRESNQLHAVCLDTWPPCVFLNDVSLSIIQWVHQVNRWHQRTLLAYSFDAGPNAFLFAEEKDVPMLLKLLVWSFGRPSSALDRSEHSICIEQTGLKMELPFSGIAYPLPPEPLPDNLKENLPRHEGGILRLISTGIGDGPRVILPS